MDRRRREMEGMDDEQVAAFYAEKYGGRSKPQTFKDTEEVPQQLLLPSVNDPNLWMVKCKVISNFTYTYIYIYIVMY